MMTTVYNPVDYFKNLTIPDTWDTLEDFVKWYMEDAKMPLMVPWDAEVIRSDDATAICIFRKPPYMIELYLIHPAMVIPYHAHPNMEVITMTLGGGSMSPKTDANTGRNWGVVHPILQPGEYHGGETFPMAGNGHALLAFEKWLDGTEMTSAAIQWRGVSAGPIQEKTVVDRYIKRFNRSALVKPGFIDITQPGEVEQ